MDPCAFNLVNCRICHQVVLQIQTAEAYNQLENCCLALERCGALCTLEKLQDHQNEEIYLEAYNFISLYFNDEVVI